MIILRQKMYSEKADIDHKKVSEIVYNYEEPIIKKNPRFGGVSKKDVEEGLEIVGKPIRNKKTGGLIYTFGAKKGSRLYDVYGPDFCWDIHKGKSGLEFMGAGD